MKTILFAILLSNVLCLVSSHSSAGEVSFPQCPEKLTIQQNNKSSINNGWKAVDSIDEHNLKGVYFSYGEYPTQQTGFIIPSEEKKFPKGVTVVYFDYLSSSKNDYAHWAACHYTGSFVVLTQKLPENVVRCESVIDMKKNTGRYTTKCFDTPRKTK